MNDVDSWQSTMEELRPCRDRMVTREVTLKVLVIGDSAVGKTTLVRRYVKHVFQQNYKETIGVDFSMKVVQWTPVLSIKLQLWDVQGHERLSFATRAYYRNAHGCMVMFDLTDTASWQSVGSWKEDLDSKCRLADGSPIPCLLLGNKNDLAAEFPMTTCDDIINLSKRYGFCTWRSISVKDNKGVDEAFRFLTSEMISKTMKTDEHCFTSFIIESEAKPFPGILGKAKDTAHNPNGNGCSC